MPTSEAIRGEDLDDLSLISIPEFCGRVGDLSLWTARAWIREGKLRSVKVFGRRMIPLSELRRACEGKLSTEAR